LTRKGYLIELQGMTTLADPTQILRSGAEDGYPFRPATPARYRRRAGTEGAWNSDRPRLLREAVMNEMKLLRREVIYNPDGTTTEYTDFDSGTPRARPFSASRCRKT